MPRILRRVLPTPLVALVTLVAAPATAHACPGADSAPGEASGPAIARTTLCLLNQERRSHGLPKLRINRRLGRAAREYSRAMVRDGFFAHVSPSGSTPGSRIRATGYLRRAGNRWCVGENLGWGNGSYASPREIVSAWMKSQGHRDNILDRRYREVGIGVAPGAPVSVDGSLAAGTYATSFGYRGS